MMLVWEQEPFGSGKIICDTLHMDQVINGRPDLLRQNIKQARTRL